MRRAGRTRSLRPDGRSCRLRLRPLYVSAKRWLMAVLPFRITDT
jgi:hypothetical protein